MRSKKNIGKVVLMIVLGALIGSLLGELVGLILPDGVVKEFFLRTADLVLAPTTLDLKVFTLTFGFSLSLNSSGFIGILLAVYLLRWY